jgi:elongation factor G
MQALHLMRNIGIMAHIDAGKTTTTERILYYAGQSYKIGEVDDGEAVMDWMEQEQIRGITIQSAITTIFWKDVQINIIDTPGHVDFTAEVERSLRVLDGAIAIFDAVHGVQPQTETVWHQAQRYHIPCIGYVNKMDRIGANFFQVLEEITAKLGIATAPIQIPIGQEGSFEGVVDLITMQEVHWKPGTDGIDMIVSPIAQERQDISQSWRDKLIDVLSTVSDAITEQFLSGEEITAPLIKEELRKAALSRALLPVCAGASRRNMGVQPLIDAVIDFLPSPHETVPVIGHHLKKNTEVIIPCDLSATPLGLVFKIQHDTAAGNLSLCYIRMYSGSLKAGDTIYNIGKKKRERINRILRMHSNKPDTLEALNAGDIGVAIGMRTAQTGDTLGSEGFPVILGKMQFPEPVISVSIEPKNISEQKRLKEVLELLSKEDPTFTTKDNEETGQLIISGMGELHLEVLVTRILEEFKVSARKGNPQVTYRESIGMQAEHSAHFSRVLANKENTADISLTVAPRNRGAGNHYRLAVTNKDIPSSIFEAVERGITASFSAGIRLGYPCTDIEVVLTGIQYSELTGTPFAYEACASACFDEACRKAGPVLLEPVMAVAINVPTEFVGNVVNLVSTRGGHIISLDSIQQGEKIVALCSLERMFGFMNELRSVSQGRARFSMEFSHFVPIQTPR